MKNKSLIILAAIILLISAPFVIYFQELRSFSEILTSSYGLLGVFLVILFMDIAIHPIPPDILIFSSALGGADFIAFALIGGLGSIIAGTFDYTVGKKIGTKGFEKLFGKNHLAKGKQIVDKYGVYGLVLGSLSPVPYSAVCWAAGIYRMKFTSFLTVNLCARLPRFLIVGFIGSLL